MESPHSSVGRGAGRQIGKAEEGKEWEGKVWIDSMGEACNYYNTLYCLCTILYIYIICCIK